MNRSLIVHDDKGKRHWLNTEAMPQSPNGKEWKCIQHRSVGTRELTKDALMIHRLEDIRKPSEDSAQFRGEWLSGLDVCKFYEDEHDANRLELCGAHEMFALLEKPEDLVPPSWREMETHPGSSVGYPHEGMPFFAFRADTFEAERGAQFYLFMHWHKAGKWSWNYFSRTGLVHRTVYTVCWRRTLRRT